MHVDVAVHEEDRVAHVECLAHRVLVVHVDEAHVTAKPLVDDAERGSGPHLASAYDNDFGVLEAHVVPLSGSRTLGLPGNAGTSATRRA